MTSSRKNVTITLDEETALWTRVEAARKDTSVSRFVGEVLRERMQGASVYEAARRRFEAQGAYLSRVPGRRLPPRDELHERTAG